MHSWMSWSKINKHFNWDPGSGTSTSTSTNTSTSTSTTTSTGYVCAALFINLFVVFVTSLTYIVIECEESTLLPVQHHWNTSANVMHQKILTSKYEIWIKLRSQRKDIYAWISLALIYFTQFNEMINYWKAENFYFFYFLLISLLFA